MAPPLLHTRRRELRDDAILAPLPRPKPARSTLQGHWVTVEPLNPARDAADLYPLLHGDPDRERVWRYLPYGPFATFDAFAQWLEQIAPADDPLFFAVRPSSSDRTEGMAALMEVHPEHGSIELGHVNISPQAQNTRATTEAFYLLIDYAVAGLGYRRCEWKCHARNEDSQRAAGRLGFSFEGTFYQHKVVKGRNRDTHWFSLLDHEWPSIAANFRRWLSPDNFDADGRQRSSLGALNRALP